MFRKEIRFSGCPFAFYNKYHTILNCIESEIITENYNISDKSFVFAFIIKQYIYDRNIQNIGDLKNRSVNG